MTTLTATPAIVIIDVEVGQTANTTSIHYDKRREDEIWERVRGSAWSGPFFSKVTGLFGDETGDYTESLRPGDTYEVGIYENERGPTTTDPISLANLAVYGLLTLIV